MFQADHSIGLEVSSDEKEETSCLSESDDEDDEDNDDAGVAKVDAGVRKDVQEADSDYSLSDQDSDAEKRMR